MKRVSFLDTSVLVELVEVPGKCQRPAEVRDEFEHRMKAGEQFVIPITAVIETGNHIAQASGHRRPAAETLVRLIEAAVAGTAPFRLHLVSWDDTFLREFCKGDGTAQPFIDLAGNGHMGAGDLAILVERDRFVANSAFVAGEVRIWTLERVLGAYS